MKRRFGAFASILFVLLFATACTGNTASETAAASALAVTPAATAEAAADTTVTDATENSGSAENGTLELTLSELSQYNGKDGAPAYVAVDGVIYDVTNLSKWKNGEHNGYSAGQDLTDIIKNKSPHGVAKLVGVPVVGKLVDG